jgi:hypothetical protein
MRNILELLWEEWQIVEQLIECSAMKLERITDADAGSSRIQQILGIGPIVRARSRARLKAKYICADYLSLELFSAVVRRTIHIPQRGSDSSVNQESASLRIVRRLRD